MKPSKKSLSCDGTYLKTREVYFFAFNNSNNTNVVNCTQLMYFAQICIQVITQTKTVVKGVLLLIFQSQSKLSISKKILEAFLFGFSLATGR